MFTRLLAGLALALMVVPAVAVDPDTKVAPTKGKTMLRAILHINFDDKEKQGHGLKNAANFLKEVGTEGAIEVVCHGAGIGLLVKDRSAHAEQVRQLVQQGVRFAACANTMRDRSIRKEDLLPGVAIVPSGIVEVVRKQQEGYGYFKP